MEKIFKKFNFYFLILLLNEGVLLFMEIARHSLPYHDGFYYFCNQYYLLNGLRFYGETPLWSPYMSHGSTMGLSYSMASGGFLFKSLFACPWLVQFASFLAWFWSSFFCDRLFLLAGTWLLSGIYFTSDRVRFFVTYTVMTSLVFYLQPGFSFYLFYCIPLVLFSLHQFFNTAKSRWLIFAGLLSVVNMLGGFFYYVPVYAFTIVFYFLVYFLSGLGTFQQIQLLFSRKVLIAWILNFIFLGLYAWIAFCAIDSDFTTFLVARDDSGRVSLGTFLNYGGVTDLSKWTEALIGLSPMHDYGLYLGALSLVLLICMLFSRNKNKILVVMVTLALLLLSMGTLVSVALYFFWPFMSSFRHLALLAPLVKIFLCFLAGFGLEFLLNNLAQKPRKYELKMALACSVFFLGVLGAFQLLIQKDSQLSTFVSTSIIDQGLHFVKMPPYNFLFWKKGFLDLLLAGVILALFFHGGKRYISVMFFVLIGLHIYDLGSYRMEMLQRRLVVPEKYLQNMLPFKKLEYKPYRFTDAHCDNRNQIRGVFDVFQSELYPVSRNFDFCDTIGFDYLTPYLPKMYTLYLNSFFITPNPKETIDKYTAPMIKIMAEPANLPLGFLKMSAFDEGKIQFFDKAYEINNVREAARLIADSRFKGDALVVSRDIFDKTSTLPDAAQEWLAKNDRLMVAYSVIKFTPNEVDIQIQSPLQKSVWLYYSDIWHPHWKAFVDGRPEPVLIGNTAYKAVELKPGATNVQFRFSDFKLSLLIKVFGIFSMICLGCLFVLLAQNLLRGENRMDLR